MLAVMADTFRSMVKASTFADRLTEALKTSGKSRADLAKRLYSDTKQAVGVSVQAVGQALDGTTKSFSANNTARAARFLGVDFYWLATGEGVARPADTNEAPVDQLVYRLGVALQAMDDLARTTAGSLLAQLASRPEDAHRIADLIRSVTERPKPDGDTLPERNVAIDRTGARYVNFPPAPGAGGPGQSKAGDGDPAGRSRGPSKKDHARP